jgi:CDP-glycerol glycerophosphotransferase
MNLRLITVRLFQLITQALDYIWPKDYRVVIFGSYGGKHTGGNCKPVFNILSKKKECNLECYFLQRKKIDDPRYLSMKPFSISTFLLLLKAKTLVMSHTLWDMGRFRPSKRKYQIHLWHGHSGPKADGYVSKRFTKENLADVERNAPYITKFLVTSRINLYFWAYAKLLHPKQLLPLGYPRNDILLQNIAQAPLIPQFLPNLPEYNKVLLYAPTYRIWAKTTYFPFHDFNRSDLEKWLEKEQAIILIRSHMAEKDSIKESSRVRKFSSDLCYEINDILPEIDLLITDYSSISSDFMLLNRPIIYIAYDKEEFEKQEGFCFGNYEFWTPGPKVETYVEFINAVSLGLQGKDGFEQRRQTVNNLINEYQTSYSAKRIARFLCKFLGAQ